MNKTVVTIVRWAVILLIPFALAFNTINFLVSDLYPNWEYNKSNFAPDFEWSTEERRALMQVAVDYLQRPEPAEEVIYLLEDQVKPGTTEPLYKPSEIKHMVDVKVLTDTIATLGLYAAAIVIAGLILLFATGDFRAEGWQAVHWGGGLTVAILAGIGLFIAVGWQYFFVLFHELLFADGTWTFLYTDSLIRLFPEKFWLDYGITIVGTIFVEGLLVWWLGRSKRGGSVSSSGSGANRARKRKNLRPKPERRAS